jgi:hypothetical protein
MLKSTVGFRVFLNGLINLDLLRKGLYRIRLKLSDDKQKQNCFQPTGCASSPSRLHSASRGQIIPDSNLGSEIGSINDDYYISRSCFIRYVDEAFDLDEVVSYEVQIESNLSTSRNHLILTIDLMRADSEIIESPLLVNVNRKSDFVPVCTRILKFPMKSIEAGLRPAFLPLTFDINNLACFTLCIQSCLLRVAFIKDVLSIPDMKSFLEKLCESQRKSEDSLSTQSYPSSRFANFMTTASTIATALASTALPIQLNNQLSLHEETTVTILLAKLRTHAEKPQSLTECLIQSYYQIGIQSRYQAISKLSSLFASAEKIADLHLSTNLNDWVTDAADAATQLMRTSLSEVQDISTDVYRLSDSDVQVAHFKLLSPLVSSFSRLTAFSAYVKSLDGSGHSSLPEMRFSTYVRNLAEICMDGNNQSCFLEDEHKRLASSLFLSKCASRYAIDGRAVGSGDSAIVHQVNLENYSDDSSSDFDSFGVHVQNQSSFRARTIAARRIEHLTNCLVTEAASVQTIISEKWVSSQREWLKLKSAVSLSLQAEFIARVRRHVNDASSTTQLLDGTFLLESSVPDVRNEVKNTPSFRDWTLDPVSSSIPSSVQLTFARVEGETNTINSLSPAKVHLVVFVHGLGGTIHDTRLLRAHLKLHHPDLVCLAVSSVQGKDTEDDIIENGVKIALEVGTFIRERLPEDGLTLGRLSFVTFSLGGILARVAIRHNSLRSFIEEFGHAFISLSSPHLSTRYGSSLVSAGVFFMRQYKTSPALTQLSMIDSIDTRNSLLFLLCEGWDKEVVELESGEICPNRAALIRHKLSAESNGSLFSRFNHVCLVASHQDTYSHFDSCLAQFCRHALDDSKFGSSYCEMARNFYGITTGDNAANAGIARRFTKLIVRFIALEDASRLLSLDGLVGRDAHVSFLESEPFASSFSVGHLRHIWS